MKGLFLSFSLLMQLFVFYKRKKGFYLFLCLNKGKDDRIFHFICNLLLLGGKTISLNKKMGGGHMQKIINFCINHFPFLNSVISFIKNIFKTNETKPQKKKGDDKTVITTFDKNTIILNNSNVVININITSNAKK